MHPLGSFLPGCMRVLEVSLISVANCLTSLSFGLLLVLRESECSSRLMRRMEERKKRALRDSADLASFYAFRLSTP